MKPLAEPIVKAKPLKGFSRKRVIYIPCDPPSRILWGLLKNEALRFKETPFGHVFLLDQILVLYGCLGAPLAGMGLEHVIASGAEDILILGFCGSLNPDLSCLEVVSVVAAHSDEGTSRHYFERKKIFRSSDILRQKVERALSARDLPFLAGTAVSTDAPYRETPRWLSDKQRKGIDVVDMEASAVFAIGEHHDVQTAALMIVSDELTGEKWKNVFKNPRINAKIEECFFPFIQQKDWLG
jgi:uridine phosphorylase